MKITIRNEKEETTMELWLDRYSRSDNDVALKGKDQDGYQWTIAIIDTNGIRLSANIEAAGWPVDADGRLKLVQHDD